MIFSLLLLAICHFLRSSFASYFVLDDYYNDAQVENYCSTLKSFSATDDLSFMLSGASIETANFLKIMNDAKVRTIPFLTIDNTILQKEAMAELIPLVPTLKNLTLSSIPDYMSNSIFASLKGNTAALELLHLSDITFDATSTTDLIQFLTSSTSIKSIYIKNPTGIVNWKDLMEAIAKNPTLTSIALKEITITDEISAALMSGFNSRLINDKISISISEDNLSSPSGKAFLEYIANNEKLIWLMRGNPIGDDAAFLFFRKELNASRHCRFICGYCGISNRGAFMMSKAISLRVDAVGDISNKVIFDYVSLSIMLTLAYNDIGIDGLRVLVETLSTRAQYFNSIIAHVHHNPLSPQEWNSLAMDPICYRNRVSKDHMILLPPPTTEAAASDEEVFPITRIDVTEEKGGKDEIEEDLNGEVVVAVSDQPVDLSKPNLDGTKPNIEGTKPNIEGTKPVDTKKVVEDPQTEQVKSTTPVDDSDEESESQVVEPSRNSSQKLQLDLSIILCFIALFR